MLIEMVDKMTKKMMDELEYLHRYSIEEQLMMETCKIEAKYDKTKSYNNSNWFIVLSEEFGEVAHNINEQQKEVKEYPDEALQENLEYELLQLATVCFMWLKKLRGGHQK